MTKVADRPHAITILLALLTVTVSALAAYISNKEKIDALLLGSTAPTVQEPSVDSKSQEKDANTSFADTKGLIDTPPPEKSAATIPAPFANQEPMSTAQDNPSSNTKQPSDKPSANIPHAQQSPRSKPFLPFTSAVWTLSTDLRGQYSTNAAAGPAKIGLNNGRLSLRIDNPDATFDCTLTFGANGDPQTASACKIIVNRQGVTWWTDDTIEFTCTDRDMGRVCEGPYNLHALPAVSSAGLSAVMRIVRFPRS